MPLEYACFISYRHSNGGIGDTLTWELSEALTKELAAHTKRRVFLDKDRLPSGTLYNKTIASALCKSACMLMVYTPTYFDPEALYCAREFKGMESLEQQRFRGSMGQNGLIIPIVLRGFNRLPNYVKGSRQCLNFEDYTLYKPKLSRYPMFMKQLRDVAAYIADRCMELESGGVVEQCDCGQFELPSDDDIRPWLPNVVSAPRFPLERAV